jgi:hypothetical protein
VISFRDKAATLVGFFVNGFGACDGIALGIFVHVYAVG